MMRFVTRYVTGVLATSLFLSLSLVPVQAQPQSDQAAFDPANPFAGITAPEQWAKKFVTGKPSLDPHDPWGNWTGGEWNGQGFYGDHAGHPDEIPLTVIGKKGTDAQINNTSRPSGGTGVIIRSPYPYKTAQEQYDAWKAAAHGGTLSTEMKTLPDWSGDWQGRTQGFLARRAKISDTMAALSPEYRPRYAEILQSQWEGHTWEPLEFCLPRNLANDYGGGTWHFMVDRHMVLLNESSFSNASRYIYTDGRGFLPEDKAQPQWYGESVGFWDGDELIIYTKNIRPWMFGTTLPEFSDELQTVERWKRYGDQMLVDITFYDPKAFSFPWHDVAIFHVVKDWTADPATYRECTTDNNVYMDAKGDIVEHMPGELGYMNLTLDPRPWASAAALWNKSHPALAAEWEAAWKRNQEMAKAQNKAARGPDQ